MSGHTPGPWRLNASDLTDIEVFVPSQFGTRYVLCQRIGGQVRKGADEKWSDYSEVEANARLIAAAPELLEALIKCADQLEIITGMVHDERQALIAARAAITKATGEKS